MSLRNLILRRGAAIFLVFAACWWSAVTQAEDAGGRSRSRRDSTARGNRRAGQGGEAASSPGSIENPAPAEASSADAAALEPEAEDSQAAQKILDDYTALAASFVQEKEEEKEIFYHQCRNISSESMKRVLENFVTASGNVASSEESDIVVAWDLKSNIAKFKEIAETIDQPVPQVLIKVQIVEITLDTDFEKEARLSFTHTAARDSGFLKSIMTTLGTPGANPLLTQGANFNLRPYVRTYESGKQNTLTLFLRYLERRGKAKILSAPSLMLRRGAEGSIITGEEVPILEQTVVSGSVSTSTVFKSVGIQLKVKPITINGDSVHLSISPEVSTVTGYSTAGESGLSNPIIAVRKASTELELKDRELISIGGLLSTAERTQKRRIPGLASLPGVGHLFRSTRAETLRTQLVIFLSVRILRQETPAVSFDIIHTPEGIPEPVQAEIKRMDQEAHPPPPRFLEDMRRFFEEEQK